MSWSAPGNWFALRYVAGATALPEVVLRVDGAVAAADRVADSVESSRAAYLAPIVLPFELPTPFHGAMLAIWYLRPALQRRFSLQRGEVRDYVRFLAWCAAEGRRQYAILRELPEWDAALARPVALPPVTGDAWAGGFSVAMFLYGVARQRYTFGGMLTNAGVRARVARGYWRGARHERFAPRPDAWQTEFLRHRFGSVERFVETLRLPATDGDSATEDLIAGFGLGDLASALDGAACRARCAEPPLRAASGEIALPARLRRSPVRLPLRAIRSLHWALDRFSTNPSPAARADVTGLIKAGGPAVHRIDHPFGVNLFGFARGEIGIGEDVRHVALALAAHGVPFCIIDVVPGANVSQQDASVERWITDGPRYAINLFCGTGIELCRYACEQGTDHLQGRYTIGLWPWELPEWPAAANHAFTLVDELWGISKHTARAYRTAPCPVVPMTLPVTIEPIGDEGRAHFGLPENTYLFVFSFDLNSTLARKNPIGAIRAFQRAFPRESSARVGLVLKASHADGVKSVEWLRLKSMIDADPRIHLIDTTLRRPQVLALYRCCDCFVSLHRAEGFGRGIAEALLLDMQVIATGFSGNLDFCDPGRVALVRYGLRTLAADDYFQGEGQHWAEPDIEHAAVLMREIVDRPRSVSAHRCDFSPGTVGTRYARRLNELKEELQQKGRLAC
jgi:hypothetical protein